MASRRQKSLALAGVLTVFLNTTFSNYLPGQGEPGLFGFAPNILLAALLGGLVAASTEHRIVEHRQFVRIAWYPGWGLLVSLPLLGVLLARGFPIAQWIEYVVVIDSTFGIGQEIRRW